MTILRWFDTCLAVENLCVSVDLATKIHLGLEELSTVREQILSLLSKSRTAEFEPIETAAACALLHSFYTEIEKILNRIARELGGKMPSSDAWHKELLNQVAGPTKRRPAVISPALVDQLSEFLAFRHLFRGASIVRMRWEKLLPLLVNVDRTFLAVREELETFRAFLISRGALADS